MTSVSKRHTCYEGASYTYSLLNSHGSSSITGNTNDLLLHSSSNKKDINPKQKRRYVTFGPYIIGSTIGQGEFGKVKLGWSKSISNKQSHSPSANGLGLYATPALPIEVPKQVAIKLIRRDTISKDPRREIKIYREINALKQLTHPNIVKLDEVLQNSKYIGIVLEYASGGEFYKYIQRKKRLKETIACKLFAQLISGVNYIHSKGLIHRDLKLENILLDKNENLIITDFGFVNEFVTSNELMKTSCGSPCYAAPELVISSQPYEARKVDIWSCGIILFAMLAGYLPWDDDPENPSGENIAKLYFYITTTPLKFPEYITAIPRDLLRRILIADPKKRVDLRYILKHQWLKPHTPFLSISPEEWDNISRSQSILRLPKHSKKQYSNNSNNANTNLNKTRPHSSCSISSMGSGNEKRNSLIMDSTLISFPVPPRESQSHVLTIPPSTSPERRHSPVSRNSELHKRSNSAASIALQAVVDAEREYYNSSIRASKDRRKSNSSSVGKSPLMNNSFRNNTSPLSKKSITGKENSQLENVFHETQHNGDTSIEDILPELPVKNSSMLHSQFGPNTYTRPTIKRGNHSNILPKHSSNISHRKPRPTSYHPGTFSTVLEDDFSFDTKPDYAKQKIPSDSQSSKKTEYSDSPFDNVPRLDVDTAVTSVANSAENSPKLYPRRSFSIKDKAYIRTDNVSINMTSQSSSKHDVDSSIRLLHEQVDNLKLNNPEDEKPERKYPDRKRFSLFAFNTQNEHVHHTSTTNSNMPNQQLPLKRDISNTIANRQSFRDFKKVARDIKGTKENAGAQHSTTAKKVMDFFKRRSTRL
ncbi:hypothetical protein KAFR_0H02540 [Kazachstania africana CBS 2517]|uniref:non-specific serine/threonine protein kinase n=1 Tax=Kazachstania africana (strain ATCC 22294 / BCRC 22015 / CBS 2517 / CECT 1963 / NBRC 1671 / NRRL Y-8276) TaxID=1071382 RepID=H2AZA7_KAZAF|nr:hypothetical protein KAFR_0H02540 [Kazachstania africana CBS 2517]CCF59663.1 hypothetical protein KAFR_0H02540 [Kazachstania africana CBS 2517]